MISISLVLLSLGIVLFLVINAQKISKHVKENIGFAVYIDENAREAEVYKLQKILNSKEYVKETEYVTKEEAAEELKKELGEDFIDFLGYIPLPASIDIFLHSEYANPDSVKVIEAELLGYEQINEVDYKKDLIVLVNENVKKISLAISGFTLLLLIIALTLINNTIRLTIYSKRFIINTMQLVGATNAFIRRPFLGSGIVQGLLSSFLAIVFLGGIIYLSEQQIGGILRFFNLESILILIASIFIFGILINLISTFSAVNKYLRMKLDRLYY